MKFSSLFFCMAFALCSGCTTKISWSLEKAPCKTSEPFEPSSVADNSPISGCYGAVASRRHKECDGPQQPPYEPTHDNPGKGANGPSAIYHS